MNPPTQPCPHCQSPVPADAPGGICPGCALLGCMMPTPATGSPPPQFPTPAEVAAAFPELEAFEPCGHGGMGIVYKARQPKLDRQVALKILPSSLAALPGFTERFTREARLLARLNHPNIVAVHDFGLSGGFHYLLMELVDGVNLRQAMRAGMTPEQALLLVPKVCDALQFAHEHGVLHRDIKPENILLNSRGEPKLADFGIAKLAGDAASVLLTASGAHLGTTGYMAPEQVEKPGTVDHRADIYSLGVVLYEMLTGELPLGRFPNPSSKAGVGPGVDEVVMRALEKERENRQQSAAEMKTQVMRAGSPGAPEVAGIAPSGGGPAGIPPWSKSAVAGALLVLASAPLGMVLFLIARTVIDPPLAGGSQLNGPAAGNVILFGFIFALAGTILGWKAVADLRLHRGHLRGGGSAVLAALFVPVLAVLTTAVVNFETISGSISPSGRNSEGAILASTVVLVAVVASVWAVRALWRAVHGGPPGLALPETPTRTGK